MSPLTGTIYIVYASNPPGVDGADVYLTASRDRGQSWSSPIRVNDDMTESDQFFPMSQSTEAVRSRLSGTIGGTIARIC